MTTNSNQISGLEVRNRLDHLGYTDSDARLLESLKSWADGNLGKFAKEFYDRQFSNPDFAAIVKGNGSNQGALEGAQAGYAIDLFRGYPNAAYVDKRVTIGLIHASVNITPEWYIASYQFYFDVLYPMVRAEFKGEEETGEQAVSALNKLLVFDRAVIMDTYINRILDQVKEVVVQVAGTAVGLSEASGQLSTTSEQAGLAVQGIASISQQVAQGSEQQTAKSQEVKVGMSQLIAAIEQVANGTQEQAGAVEQAATIVNQVSKATEEVAKNAQLAADGSRQANEAADAGKDLVSRTVTGMERIKNAVDTAATRMVISRLRLARS